MPHTGNQIMLDVLARTASISVKNNLNQIISTHSFNNGLMTISAIPPSISNDLEHFEANFRDIGLWLKLVEHNILNGYLLQLCPEHIAEYEFVGDLIKLKVQMKNTSGVMTTILDSEFVISTKTINIGVRPQTELSYAGYRAFYLAVFHWHQLMVNKLTQPDTVLGEHIVASFKS